MSGPNFFLSYVCVHKAEWADAYHVHAGAHGGQRALDILELELQWVVSCLARGLGIKPRSSVRAANAAEPSLQPLANFKGAILGATKFVYVTIVKKLSCDDPGKSIVTLLRISPSFSEYLSINLT